LAPNDGDGAASRITVENEVADAREVGDAEAQADPPLEDVGAIMEVDKTEV
jgi:hypothetical protein